jgi:recombinational DNA repair protein (RecF pathway)
MQTSERIRKVEAVVITHKDFGEADRLIRLFSLEHGKLSALAKGARKIRSRKAAHIEPFTYAVLVLARGQSFWIITQADTKDAYPNIRENLIKTVKAAYILELADQLTGDEQPEPGIFHLITDTMKRIDKLQDPFNAILNSGFWISPGFARIYFTVWAAIKKSSRRTSIFPFCRAARFARNAPGWAAALSLFHRTR